jgi:16S rRNA (adenine1518-N6/adenine1519-N6)-dimethyltransferase
MEAPHPSRLIVLTLQREVAERIVAGPGEMSLLALSVGVYGRPSLRGRIAAGAFYPRPGVDSAVLRIDVDDRPRVASGMIDPIFALARAGFGQKRKKLVNALASRLDESRSTVAGWLEDAAIPATARAQELTVLDWGRLASVRQRTGEGRSG